MINFQHKVYECKEMQDGYLVIYSWGALSEETNPKVWENVDFYNLNGQKIWTVNGMENYKYWIKSRDCFVGFREHEGRLQLVSFGGNSYDVDMDTGLVIHFEFHK